MAISMFSNFFDMFLGSASAIARYVYFIIPIVLIIFAGLGFWFYSKIKDKKNQWTHRLRVRRELSKDGRLSAPVIHNMRRFPLIKRAEVFELETPLLGSYLLPDPGEYSGVNEYDIILDRNNRIYLCTGDYFNPDTNSCNVSARHAEIDVQRATLKADYQNINRSNKRLEWSTIAKYAFMVVGIIAITIIAIIAIQKWGEAQEYKAAEAQAMEKTMEHLSEAMTTVSATVNTQKLMLPMLKELLKTENLQQEINRNMSVEL